ncbi:MAG: T9SS type A sorting domain-containing protein [Bacteroidetes bacterium]|nr:T9SS type A sorting domain-containing protein [Bacteroidota bacterium]
MTVRFILFLSLMMSGLSTLTQTIIPGGFVSGTWDKSGSPYLVQGDVTVHSDSFLYILPGTEVRFGSDNGMDVYGVLKIIGVLNDSVFLTATDTTLGWNGLGIYNQINAGTDSSEIRFAKVQYAGNAALQGQGGALYAENSARMIISNSRLCYNRAESGAGIYLRNSPVNLKNLRIDQNTAGNKGGGIFCHNSNVILDNIHVIYNNSLTGAGLYLLASDVLLTGSSINHNISMAGGGGAVLHEGSDGVFSNTSFSWNTAHGSGGGVALLENSLASFSYCSFEGNNCIQEQYLAYGGGVFITNYDNIPVFTNCVFLDNHTDNNGGGLYSESPLRILNSLVVYNLAGDSATLGGGGLFLGKEYSLIINTTFSDNMAAQGSAFYLWAAGADVFNSVVWDDLFPPEKRIFLDALSFPARLRLHHGTLIDGEASIGGRGVFNLEYGDEMLDSDPLFIGAGNFNLTNNSPCIDKGLLDSLAIIIPPFDLAGNPRVVGDSIDMGCYENQHGIGIFTLQEETGCRIYPSPFTESFKVELLDGMIIDVLLYDLSGKRLIYYLNEQRQDNKSCEIYVPYLSPGIYILNIITSKGKVSARLIKK